jgi:hypothetical protein
MDVGIQGLLLSSEPFDDCSVRSYVADSGTSPHAVQIDAILSSYGCELSSTDLCDSYNYGWVNPYAVVNILRRVEGSAQGPSYTSYFILSNRLQSRAMARWPSPWLIDRSAH